METTNINLWAMYSELQKHSDNYSMGFTTRAEYASHCYSARMPYMGRTQNFLLYLRDRWF